MSGESVVVSGMRPTGRLHLGHLEGVIRNWLCLQEKYPCYFFVADLHALTDRTDPGELREWSREMVRDWLALGIDPEKTTLFIQSHVPQHAELAVLLGMVTPVSWAERCPTYKDRIAELGKASERLGLLAYPVLMAADVALYGADKIPVGLDQVAHLELAREIVRRFNATYRGSDLVEPKPLLTKAQRLMGTDGRKMSKSYGNTLELSAEWSEVEARVRKMKTDEARKRRTDAGNPENCNLFPYHEIYSKDRCEEIKQLCTTAGIGCVDCKKIFLENYARALEPYRQRRVRITDEEVEAVLKEGARRARAAAAETMARVRDAVGLMK
ncbi:MAG: tryptophan--tRNA ligase [Candidatus Hydrogenedentota bacterium]|nr:MAG: tryptophan--tRNA ligase [Candidatus Hydrogenedentota bacterium]